MLKANYLDVITRNQPVSDDPANNTQGSLSSDFDKKAPATAASKSSKKSKSKSKAKNKKKLESLDSPSLAPESPSLEGIDSSELEKIMGMSEAEIKNLKASEKKAISQKLKSQGNKFFSSKQFEQAIDYYSKALMFDENPVFYSNRAACYDALEKYDLVISDCTAALKLQPNYFKALLRRAKAYEATDNLRESLYDFTVACIIDDFKNAIPSEGVERVVKNLAEGEAKQILSTRKPRVPSKSFISGYFNSFVSNGARAVPEKSGDKLSKAERLYNKSLDLLDTKDYAGSISCVDSAIKEDIEKVNKKAAADAYSLRGAYNFLKGSLDLAEADFDHALTIDPNHVLTMYRKSNMFAEKKELDKSQELLKKALEISPENAEGYFHSGQIYFINQDFQSASEMYQKAIKCNSEYVYPYIQSGVALFKLGQVSAAIETFNNAMVKFPNRSDLYNYYGEVLAENNGGSEAIAAFDKSIKIDKLNPLPYVNKALTLFQTSANYENAFGLIKQALDADPECELAVAALSQVYLQLGMFEDSLEMLNRAVQLAKSEEELVSTITFRETTSAQYKFITEHPEMVSKLGRA
ncbi:hypothetical protein BB560_006071 [Smittium megazygosporum]|uniref:Uncharacterized protein n=1 Tax=Smittium megazygosporum TaxID=133381 RepID=A0A2T9YIW5_9FUNG|nr:hypothetical protein BB560_006071 [Smittium megazygosporum]